MGVPKFYRWLSERYPRINQIISDLMLMPEFDNLYLDMNGIIHHCTHPNDDDLAAALSEKDVMLGIFNYIDRIVTQIAKPRKLLFMAIDGVAPRAKLNQQRSRRFASAKDAGEARAAAEAKGDLVDASASFDSNCITPGTPFMQRVSEHLRYFIRKKQHEDPLWRRLTVVFSGHEVPGEGEHKIMQRIRELREDPECDPNTSHCMYGQDADLIMLGLVSHEPHFTLLREVINFNQNRKSHRDPQNVSKTVVKQSATAEFQLLHVSILREYLEIELCQHLYLKGVAVNLERVIDDFVFMTFLVGNDFLPHLPSLDIGEGAFDRLFTTYKQQMLEEAAKPSHTPTTRDSAVCGAYLTSSGSVPNLERLEVFLAAIGAMEDEIFKERAATEKEFQDRMQRRNKRFGGGGQAEGPSEEEKEAMEAERRANFDAALAANRNNGDGDPAASSNGHGGSNSGGGGGGGRRKEGDADFEYQKGLYYFEKLGITPQHESVHEAVRKHYLEGLLWCLAYYYRGCVSWGWFYPFHYGPMMSDMKGLPQLGAQIEFVKGRPFLPFQQLLGCLPAASRQFLPKAYQFLMADPASPIIDFFPADFKVDMNGKRNPWEGVNLLPFIDTARMHAALATHCDPSTCLTEDERKRNAFGDPIEFVWHSDDDSTSSSSSSSSHAKPKPTTVKSVNPAIGLPDLVQCRTVARSRPDLLFDRTDVAFLPEVKPGCLVPYPGFPSMHVLPIPQASLKPLKLNCFGSESRYSTFTLGLPVVDPQHLPPGSELAKSVLGQSCFVNWPMMHEARILALSDPAGEYTLLQQTGQEKQRGDAKRNSTTAILKRGGGGGGGGKNNPTAQKEAAPATADGGGGSGGEKVVSFRAFSEAESHQWTYDAAELRDEYLKGRGVPGQGGVDVGPVCFRLSVAPLQGMFKHPRDGSRSKVFASSSGDSVADVPLQLAIWQNPAPDPRFLETGPLSVGQLAPLGTRAMLVSGVDAKLAKHHGRVGTVVGHNDNGGGNTVSLRVPLLPKEPPFGLGIAAAVVDKYFPTSSVARTLGIRPDILGRVLGSLIVDADSPQPSRGGGGGGSRGGGGGDCFDLGLRLRITEASGVKGERGAVLRVLGYVRHTGVAEEATQAHRRAEQAAAKAAAKAVELAKKAAAAAAAAAGGGRGGGGGGAAAAAEEAALVVAWDAERDSVRVVGSKARKKVDDPAGAGSGGGPMLPPGGWEMSMKAVQLVQAYKNTFPALFEALNNSSTSREKPFFSAKELFGGRQKGPEEGSSGATPSPSSRLEEVVEWLGSLEVMRLPRAPLTTDALGVDAVKAVQKAADTRNAALAAQITAQRFGGSAGGGLSYEVVDGLKLEHLCLAPSPLSLRDVKVDHNQLLGPPNLGDRVLNAHGMGVPFGLRGTVVGVHRHSGAVECVFDEQFVGGSSLQGTCDKFRGRLVPWRHLLKATPLQQQLPSSSSSSSSSPPPPPPPVQQQQQQQETHTKMKKNKRERAVVATPPPPSSAEKEREAPQQKDDDDDDDEEVLMLSTSPSCPPSKSSGLHKSDRAPTTDALAAAEAAAAMEKEAAAADREVAAVAAAVLTESVRNLFVGFGGIGASAVGVASSPLSSLTAPGSPSSSSSKRASPRAAQVLPPSKQSALSSELVANDDDDDLGDDDDDDLDPGEVFRYDDWGDGTAATSSSSADTKNGRGSGEDGEGPDAGQLLLAMLQGGGNNASGGVSGVGMSGSAVGGVMSEGLSGSGEGAALLSLLMGESGSAASGSNSEGAALLAMLNQTPPPPPPGMTPSSSSSPPPAPAMAPPAASAPASAPAAAAAVTQVASTRADEARGKGSTPQEEEADAAVDAAGDSARMAAATATANPPVPKRTPLVLTAPNQTGGAYTPHMPRVSYREAKRPPSEGALGFAPAGRGRAAGRSSTGPSPAGIVSPRPQPLGTSSAAAFTAVGQSAPAAAAVAAAASSLSQFEDSSSLAAAAAAAAAGGGAATAVDPLAELLAMLQGGGGGSKQPPPPPPPPAPPPSMNMPTPPTSSLPSSSRQTTNTNALPPGMMTLPPGMWPPGMTALPPQLQMMMMEDGGVNPHQYQQQQQQRQQYQQLQQQQQEQKRQQYHQQQQQNQQEWQRQQYQQQQQQQQPQQQQPQGTVGLPPTPHYTSAFPDLRAAQQGGGGGGGTSKSAKQQPPNQGAPQSKAPSTAAGGSKGDVKGGKMSPNQRQQPQGQKQQPSTPAAKETADPPKAQKQPALLMVPSHILRRK